MDFRIYIALTCIILYVVAVDHSNFKTCDKSSFCRRLRGIKPRQSPYELNLDTLEVTQSSVGAELINTEASVTFKFLLTALAGLTFRVNVDEKDPLFPRYKVSGVLNGEPQHANLEILERNKSFVVIKSGNSKVLISAVPFKVEFYVDDKVVSVLNARGLFEMEHLRKKKVPPSDIDGEQAPLDPPADEKPEDPGAWEENFKSHHDSKERGPEAIAMDITFPGAARAYGLPEHADRLALRTTAPGGTDPYRLYNLDVFEYELESTMAIYGAVPVLYAHSTEHTTGVFWHNAAETWVDITNSKDSNVVSSIVNLVSGSKSETNVDAHFMSESGIIDLFVLLGPTPKDAVRQYATLTGTAPLPQYFTLAYHQSRWNYNDEDDVKYVVASFDEHNLPLDIMWLDIEYTDAKKYFTWDSIRFPHPDVMQKNLTGTGRKLVVIIDPHIKRENGYFLHEESLDKGYYVKNKDGNVYEGWCWPGSSSYLDFFDPAVLQYYSSLYALDKFPGATNDMYLWNDMNEPSVFNGPEITMPKDCMHYGGWEHRHVHNIYGLLQTKGSYDGLLARSKNTRRPFILSRAHFAGTQRYAAIWTGDNSAEWSHLAISIPMCLSEALAGISFCGADIGGFFNNPDNELLTRWYQAGIWLPFYRAHAHIDTKRREPYLLPSEAKIRIRTALRTRYAHLPYWYTLFWEHQRNGDPVIRPLFWEYPKDANVIDVDNELLVGGGILAHPVTEAGVSTVTVYLPGGANEYWYDIESYKMFTGLGNVNIPVTIEKNPAYYRGGYIIPRKDRPRRSSTLTHNDPYTLIVALDANKSAKGTLYIDDGESFEYKNKNYIYLQLSYNDNHLASKLIDHQAKYATKAWLERVIILGAPIGVTGAKITSKGLGSLNLKSLYEGEYQTLVIRKPGVGMFEPWDIELLYTNIPSS